MSKNINLQPSLNSLIKKITYEIEKGKLSISGTVDSQKNITYWNIGKLITYHLSFYSDKVDYGQYLFLNLSLSLNIGIKLLYLMVKFYRTYPVINLLSDKLSWGHFRILFTLKSDKEREIYTRLILRNNLSTRDLYFLIKKEHDGKFISNRDKINFITGIPYIYNFKSISNRSLLDIGFHTYSDNYIKKTSAFDIGCLVEVNKTNNSYSFNKVKYSPEVLYTYKAYLKKVVDGDTITADIDLGFNIFTTQKLRLRGINAQELNTSSGKKAREFIISKLTGLDFVMIKTYHLDKYSRYLADVFYSSNDIDISSIVNISNFLNQQLLDNKLAEKYFIY
jgi:endonuclease YncB( thermonuclease family)